MSGDGPTFTVFFEHQHADLSRLAYLLTGDATRADDLAADALLRVRRRWPRVGGDDPEAYARGMVATLTRDRRGLFDTIRREPTPRHETTNRTEPTPRHQTTSGVGAESGALDVRGALRRLPHRRRVCVVLRYAFGLTEPEVARALGISIGAVRTRTSRGARQLSALIGYPSAITRLADRETAR